MTSVFSAPNTTKNQLAFQASVPDQAPKAAANDPITASFIIDAWFAAPESRTPTQRVGASITRSFIQEAYAAQALNDGELGRLLIEDPPAAAGLIFESLLKIRGTQLRERLSDITSGLKFLFAWLHDKGLILEQPDLFQVRRNVLCVGVFRDVLHSTMPGKENKDSRAKDLLALYLNLAKEPIDTTAERTAWDKIKTQPSRRRSEIPAFEACNTVTEKIVYHPHKVVKELRSRQMDDGSVTLNPTISSAIRDVQTFLFINKYSDLSAEDVLPRPKRTSRTKPRSQQSSRTRKSELASPEAPPALDADDVVRPSQVYIPLLDECLATCNSHTERSISSDALRRLCFDVVRRTGLGSYPTVEQEALTLTAPNRPRSLITELIERGVEHLEQFVQSTFERYPEAAKEDSRRVTAALRRYYTVLAGRDITCPVEHDLLGARLRGLVLPIAKEWFTEGLGCSPLRFKENDVFSMHQLSRFLAIKNELPVNFAHEGERAYEILLNLSPVGTKKTITDAMVCLSGTTLKEFDAFLQNSGETLKYRMIRVGLARAFSTWVANYTAAKAPPAESTFV